jgi:urate oxidase
MTFQIDATQGKDKLFAKVSSGIRDLLVLKSTGSAFHSFIRDEFTTLSEVNDRIFSTSVALSYKFPPVELSTQTVMHKNGEKEITVSDIVVPANGQEPKGSVWDTELSEKARNLTMRVFAEDDSASVQVSPPR